MSRLNRLKKWISFRLKVWKFKSEMDWFISDYFNKVWFGEDGKRKDHSEGFRKYTK